MRKHTQLADLILGSGLVGDSKRQAGQDHEDLGGRPQTAQGPALYQFGAGKTSSRRPQSAASSRPGSATSQSRERQHADPGHPSSKPGELVVSGRLPPHPPSSSSVPTSFHVQTLEWAGGTVNAADVQYVALPGNFSSGGRTLQPSKSHSRSSSSRNVTSAWAQPEASEEASQAVASKADDPDLVSSASPAGVCTQQMWASPAPEPTHLQQPFSHPALEETPWSSSEVSEQPDSITPQLMTRDSLSQVALVTTTSSPAAPSHKTSQDGRPSLSHIQLEAAGAATSKPSVRSSPTDARGRLQSQGSFRRGHLHEDDQLPVTTSSTTTTSTASKVSASQDANKAAQDELQLRLRVSALETKVAELKQELVGSQAALAEARAETQVVSQQARAVACKWEQEKGEASLRNLRLVKQAEQAQERAEVARRMAERRAAAAEHEVHNLKSSLSNKEAEHHQVVSNLQASLESNQAAAKSHAAVLEGMINGLREELQSVRVQKHADNDFEKKGLQEALEKQRQEVARRTQTILSLTSECDAAQKQKSSLEAKQLELQSVIASLQHQLKTGSHHTGSSACHSLQSASEASVAPSSSSAASTTGTSKTVPSEAAAREVSTCGSRSSEPRQASCSPARPPSSSGKSRSGHSSSSGFAGQDIQTQLAKIRQEHAQRVAELEEAVRDAESAARDTVHNCQQLFQALVDRTAHMLAGRLSTEGGGTNVMAVHGSTASNASATLGSVFISRDLVSSSGLDSTLMGHQPLMQRPPTPTKKASAAAAAAGNDKLALLYAMNDKLSSENARLLAELARFHSGKHSLLRRASMVVLGSPSDGCSSLPPQAGLPAGLLKRSTSDSNSGTTSLPSPRTSASGSASASKHSDSNDSTVGQKAPSPAKLALSLAVKEVLLCSRKQLLPAVMTSEGWDSMSAKQSGSSGAASGLQSLMSTKADSMLACAEQLTQLQAQHMVLQAEAVRLQAQLVSVSNEAAIKAQSQMTDKAGMAQLASELSAAQKRVSELEEQLRSARYGYTSGSAGGASATNSVIERDADARVQMAREEAQRHRNAAAAASRDRDALDKQLEEQRQVSRTLEQQLRESKVKAHDQDQTVKRVRALLNNARALLRDAGIAFMEDDVHPGYQDTSIPSSRTSSTNGEPGSLFKAVDAREKEKEVQRMQVEMAEWQHRATASAKELKLLRSQMSKKEGDLRKALAEMQADTAKEIGALKHEAVAAQDAKKQAERKALDCAAEASQAQRTCQELASKVEKLQVQSEYLKQRATQLRHQRPRLAFATALSMNISAQQMTS